MANVARRAFRGTGNRLRRQFSGHDVQVVIALHPGAAAAASLWKRKQPFLLASIATDLVVHEFQAFKEIDQVYCDRRAMVLIAPRNLSSFSERARFSGLPVEEKFFQRQNIERSKNCTNVLFSFGAMGLGSTNQLHRFLSAIAKDPKLVATIVCGHNSEMLQIAKSLICKFGIQCRADVLGFVDNMDELLQVADILVGKPGGLTSGELMASGKPAVILELLPGQEEYNLQVLQRFGMASFAPRGPLDDVIANVSRDPSVQNIAFLQNPRKRGVNAIIDGICETIESEHCRKQSALATAK
jgi:processive 1,2-diacylglycerol beta-glucosyltransferase